MMTEICANCIHWTACEAEGVLPNDYCGMYQEMCATEQAEYDKLIKVLTDLDITLVDEDNEYRSVYDIMKDIASKWELLTSMEQAALTETIDDEQEEEKMTPLIDRRPEKLMRLNLIAVKASTPEQMLGVYNSLVDAYNAIIDAHNRLLDERIAELKEEETIKHGHLIDLPRALDSSERPVKCSVCGSVMSLYHGYKPRYCSDCGAKFDKEEEE